MDRSGSGHVDTFAEDNLPPRALWPTLIWPLPELQYPERLNCAASLVDAHVDHGRGDRIALLHPSGAWTYAELLATSNRIARVLTEDLDVVPGNRVLLRGPNSPMMVALWIAVLKAGGICVTTMPLLRSRELGAICDKAAIRLALTDDRMTGEIGSVVDSSALRRVVCFGSGGEDSIDSRMRSKSTSFTNADTAADDVALIAFTSGTTGVPKGTMHFHRDVLAICDCFPKHILRPEPDDIFCGSPPIAFTYGLGGILLFPLRIAATSLLLEDASPPALLDAIAHHRATICFTAPTAYRAMAPMTGQHDLSSLRKCVSAGETLPRSTFELWRDRTGVRIIDGIGSTELLHVFISTPEAEIRPGSTGRVVPGYEACTLDDEGRPLPPGEIGRLAVRGPTGCRYLADEERQRAYVHDGWNLTGDAYVMDRDGYFWYQARTDDMIISSGYNIAGPEVENVLLEHACVQECAVVGLPDEQRGRIVAAFIVLRPGFAASADLVKELQDHVKAGIAPYKYPRRIEFVEHLPRTQTGKLQRFVLREDHG
jgi:2-aminobenzoate-CoA ligase